MDPEAHSPDGLLDLLEDYMNLPDQPAKDDDTSSAFDSELTEDEDPNYPPPCPAPKRLKLYTSPPCHFTKSDEFWDSVAKVVTSYMDDAWFSMDEGPTLDRLGEDWDRNVSAVTTAITGIAREAQLFKIGITEDPKHRWFVCDNGNYSNTFTKMTVVYVATSSKKLHHQSTGNMERTQISKFKTDEKCMNKAPGGEGASDGSPHFCYVVWK
jgi:hypothetical protein